MERSKPETINEYIKTFPRNVQEILEKIRQTIQKAAPDAKEKIGYGIPTFTYHGNLVHFAGFKHHIGFYPTPSAIKKFKNELASYKQAKGSVQFLLDQPIPYFLITEVVKFRVKQNEEKNKK